MSDAADMKKTTSDNAKEKPHLKVGFGIGIGEYSTAAIAGTASGIFAAVKTIRDKFMDDARNSTDLKPFFQDLADKLAKINVEIGQGATLPTRVASEDFAKATRNMKRDHAILRDEKLLVTRGVRNTFIGGTIDRAMLMSESSIKGIIFNTIVGIALGAAMTLSFFNGVVTRAKINAIDNAVESDLENQPKDQKPLAYKDRDPLPPKELAKNDDKTAAHAEKVAAEISGKSQRDKYPELREEHAEGKSHAEHVGEPKGDGLKEERSKASHVDKLADADQQQAFAAAR